ncbi:aspartic peptidase domain-containing protein [Talaromyces proteolyticus]|uniref:Aspartic peptidase domain-containing protein n=1 Tax=Talaromyces proteolyticus TaxID=1131652 RepID=A0AAD4Q394_9EURO|nr:aspartic peptidase domain-containing protein [Talaromyces proteolyticus]KAH8701542.1 aspartic peptidase domain-containing protein [Talaromyces proteolyticus]
MRDYSSFACLALATSMITSNVVAMQVHTRPKPVGGSLQSGRTSLPAVKIPHKRLGDRATSTVDVGSNWYIEAWIGTPGQSFYFLADSGAPNLSIESTLEPASQQGDIPLYNPTNSSTAQLMEGYTYSECFGSGYCDNGVVYTDIFTVGQIAYEGMPIMVQTNNTSPSNGVRSGNMGLNIDLNGMTTEPQRLPSFFQHLLPDLDDFRASNNSGQFDFGYVDSGKYTGNIAYGNITTTGGFGPWRSRALGLATMTVVFDTGTGGGSISREIADLYWSQVPSSQWNDGWNNYLYPCNQTLPDFVIQLADGNKVGIPSDGLFSKAADDGSGLCATMLAIADGNDTLWGQAWIEKFFVIFDWGNRRLGVANKSQ